MYDFNNDPNDDQMPSARHVNLRVINAVRPPVQYMEVGFFFAFGVIGAVGIVAILHRVSTYIFG